MGKLHPTIPKHVLPWLAAQHMFWVATAPLEADTGHVNVSPKCTEGTFHVVDERKVWYEDLTGSGVETISHIRENRRISILFHAFEGPPQIVRIYGKGAVHEYGTPEYKVFLPGDNTSTTRLPGSRAVIVIDVVEVMTTCGFSVPLYQFISYRTKLHDWATKLESKDRESLSEPSLQSHPTGSPTSPPKDGMKSWWQTRNTASLDGLPGLQSICNNNNLTNPDAAAIVGPTRPYLNPYYRPHLSTSPFPLSYLFGIAMEKKRVLDLLTGIILGSALTFALLGFSKPISGVPVADVRDWVYKVTR